MKRNHRFGDWSSRSLDPEPPHTCAVNNLGNHTWWPHPAMALEEEGWCHSPRRKAVPEMTFTSPRSFGPAWGTEGASLPTLLGPVPQTSLTSTLAPTGPARRSKPRWERWLEPCLGSQLSLIHLHLNPFQTLLGKAHLPHFTEEERKALENGKEGPSPIVGIQTHLGDSTGPLLAYMAHLSTFLGKCCPMPGHKT